MWTLVSDSHLPLFAKYYTGGMKRMITYKQQLGNQFLVETSEYPNNLTASEQSKIRWIESEIINKTNDFLQDPEWYVSEWEDLTGIEMPHHYIDFLPLKVTNLVYGKKHHQEIGIQTNLLPLQNAKGESIHYSEERLMADYLRYNLHVYDLDKKLKAQPIPA